MTNPPAPTNTPPSNVVLDAARALWSDRIKPWLDFREYLRQRSLILERLDVEDEPGEDKARKSPVEFAAWSITLAALLVQLIAAAFTAAFKPPEQLLLRATQTRAGSMIIAPTYIAGGESLSFAKAEQATRDIEYLRHEREKLVSGRANSKYRQPPPLGYQYQPDLFMLEASLRIDPIDKSAALKAYDDEITAVEANRASFIIDGRYQAFMNNEVVKAAVPYLFVALAATLFSLFLGSRFPGGRSKAARVYLYCLTAAVFWPLVSTAIAQTAMRETMLYSPPSFEEQEAYFGKVLESTGAGPPEPADVRAFPFQLVLGASAVWSIWMIGWIARRLARAYPNVGAIRFFLGAVGANMLAGLALTFASFALSQVAGIASDFINAHKLGGT